MKTRLYRDKDLLSQQLEDNGATYYALSPAEAYLVAKARKEERDRQAGMPQRKPRDYSLTELGFSSKRGFKEARSALSRYAKDHDLSMLTLTEEYFEAKQEAGISVEDFLQQRDASADAQDPRSPEVEQTLPESSAQDVLHIAKPSAKRFAVPSAEPAAKRSAEPSSSPSPVSPVVFAYTADTHDLLRKRLETPRTKTLLADKARSYEAFSCAINRPWCLAGELDITALDRLSAYNRRAVAKPVRGSGGKGIKAVNLENADLDALRDRFAGQPAMILEGCITQHAALEQFTAQSVNTLRLVTLSSKRYPVTAKGDEFAFAYAAIRVGDGASVLNCLHRGGLEAFVDLETGIVTGDGTTARGDACAAHPESEVPFRGLSLPFFAEAKEAVRTACLSNALEGFLSWDVALTPAGPEIIEANARFKQEVISAVSANAGLDPDIMMKPFFFWL